MAEFICFLIVRCKVTLQDFEACLLAEYIFRLRPRGPFESLVPAGFFAFREDIRRVFAALVGNQYGEDDAVGAHRLQAECVLIDFLLASGVV